MGASKKTTNRIFVSALNALRYLIIPAGSILFAFLVKRNADIQTWGSVVNFMIIVSLVHMITHWSMKEFSLRAFSKQPSQVTQINTENFFTRLPILLIGFLLLAFYFPIAYLPWLIIWLTGLFLSSSTEALCLYYKKQLFVTLVEFILIIAVCVMIIQNKKINTEFLVQLFSVQQLIKGIFYFAYFQKDFRIKYLSFEFSLLAKSFPLFIIGISGMLFSKIDLYIINWRMDDLVTGKYQILISLLLYLQALGGLLIMPLQKVIYRSGSRLISKLATQMVALGGMICLLALPVLYVGLPDFFDIYVSPDQILLSGLYVLPIYYCLPIIYFLYAVHQEKKVLMINIAGFILNAGLTWLLVVPYGISGALFSAGICQFLMLIAYIGLFLRYRKK